ncbi:PREDICTED: putative two-component response regulator-like APRR4 [Tarenaya hassleriana]|uniref:putative two-component response regulator-like APRR4 n=1 Tax=Tarenaya hassleriana TaxID=28532 RepID=UPI00053C331A|nr:PREDICTED: putative two-component response regulator-like APRR4 [Tarenaya hassleriana]
MTSNSRSDRNSSDMFYGNFPEGLRVLVLEDDLSSLLMMEEQLLSFKYQVTKCHEEEEALSLLRNNPESRFDMVIIDIHYICKFWSQDGSKINLPIIVMSSEYSVESVVEVMKKGACDYITKPVEFDTLRMIYKHVAKTMVDNAGIRNCNKRVEEEEEDNASASASASKKRRVVWSPELREKFLDAVNQLGLDSE